jgi:hypothetical protein
MGKKTKTGYILFVQEQRPKVKAANPELLFGAIAKALGQQWKSLTDAQRQGYNDRAKNEARPKAAGRK